jgi:hypothetical protein
MKVGDELDRREGGGERGGEELGGGEMDGGESRGDLWTISPGGRE